MNKSLITTNQSAKVALSKSKKLLNIANRILKNKDNEWMQRLWEWADENKISDLKYYEIEGWIGIPRDKNKLLNLTEFNLGWQELSELSKEIGNLINLKILRLNNLSLDTIPDTIYNLKNIKELYFGDNPHHEMIDGSFSNFITNISKKIKNLKKLKILKLDNNPIEELPLEIGFLLDLENMSLYGCGLNNLPRTIVNLLHLKKLDLSSNQLTKLPTGIRNLSNLIELDLSANDLIKAPEEIVHLKNLTSLSLSYNNLIELPKNIKNLKNLKGLYLYNNQFTKLPKEIMYLKNLTSLDLSKNNLTELPKEIMYLKNLTSLSLEENPNLILTKEQKKWVQDLINRNSTDWYGVEIDDDLFDRTFFNGRIKNCKFSYKCPLEWNNLEPTDDVDIKYCEICNNNVYRINSESEFKQMADNQRCVYIEHIELLGYPAHTMSTIDIDDELPF